MIWIITVYLFGSTAIAISTWSNAGFVAGLSALGTGLLAVTAAGGLKFGILRGDRQQRVGVALVAIAILGISYWLSLNFSIHLFGAHLTGSLWGFFGAAIGFICVTKHMTAK